MLVIRAVSLKGQPVPREISVRFDESGGTIGRGEHSTMVLPDPQRYISRTHATIAFQAGGFVITDNSTKNPVLLNGRALGAGGQGRLTSGDHITLGDYVLEVALAAAAKDDPLAAFGDPAPGRGDPFEDPLRPPAGAIPAADPGSPPDVEPAAPRAPASSAPQVAPLPPDILDILRGPEPKIDKLYDLTPSRPNVLGPEPPHPPSPSAPEDPFALLDVQGEPEEPGPRPTVQDHGPEIFTPYTPPAATHGARAAPASRLAPSGPGAPPGPEPMIPGSFAMPGPKTPGASAVPASTPPRGSVDPAPMTAGVLAEPVLQPATGGRAAQAEEELLRAFLQGAGIADTRIKALAPETMEAIGQLLRAAVQGTLELLRARGLTKSEMGADVTMIMPLDNNPLKFSPNAGAALLHLLAPSMPGFMPPLRAMKSAYDDLRAHQMGFLAGMRAALDEVLARFAPDELEKRLSDPSVLDSVLPMNRKAKLWDLFVQRYGDVAGEAREDFNIAFGKAFRRAYDAQVEKLRAESA